MFIFKNYNSWLKTILSAAILSFAINLKTASAEDMSTKKLWDLLNKQQEEINKLKKQLQETDEKAEAVTEAVENQPSVGSSGGWFERTTLGGYGELHYNGGDKDEIDFHRFVAFINHEFTDKIRLFTEVELEHSLAGEGKEGEVELEQAYIEFDIRDNQHLLAGLYLVPIGILNETHEPPTFFGVERNPVESNIIPSTWWEAGVAARGELSEDLSYNLAFHSGLKTPIEEGNAFKIRNGRQKVSEATAKDPAVTARLKWTGISGVELGLAAQYQADVTQGQLDESIDATLVAATADIRKGPFGFRALYAQWDLDGEAPQSVGRDEQFGWYVEPSYYFDTEAGEMGVFARYNVHDNNAGSSEDTEFEQIDLGLNFWPHPNVVLKADMAFVEAPSGQEDDEILNLGVGFMF